MLLCDIGNTSYHFYDGSYDFKESALSFDPSHIKEPVFYICVNTEIAKKLQDLDNWSNLSAHVDKKCYYDSMGIDRIMAVEAVDNGVIIDAGSAVTVDIVRDGTFMGGFIYPGLQAIEKTYREISPVLNCSIDYDVDLQELPKNTEAALSYGYLKTLYCEVRSHELPIILTGGDAQKLQRVFKDGVVRKWLVFQAMQRYVAKYYGV